MKKIVVLILFAFSISFVDAQKSEEITRLEKLNLKPIKSVMDEQKGIIDNETRALRVNRNESFKSETLKETNAIALFYLQEKRDVYGLSGNLNDIKITETVESPAGQYVYCQQYMNDIPVFATNFIIYFNKENIITYTLNEFRNVAKYRDVKDKPSVNVNNALKTANEYLNITGNAIDNPKTELVYFESIDKGLELAWKINIISTKKPLGSWQIFVSAEAGHIIHVESTRTAANGNGKVFNPNPLVSANVSYGGNYVHNNGATNSYLDGQLLQVTLNDITYENGLYKLKGPYCTVQDLEYPYGHNIPELATSNFYYTRNQEEFEAVMCYYHVDLSARRIMQLGYAIPNGLKNLRVDPHGAWGDRNAYYDWSNYLTFGGGGDYVDAAEDADVIWHEYGHAIQFNFTPAGMSYSGETQSLQEGSSDYWATSYKRQLYPNYWQALCVWFDMNIPVVARRADLNWVYPTNYVWGHNGGQIWSSALMKIWGDLGKDITDQLFLETHLIWGYSPNMRDAATAFMQADLHLYNGSHLCQIYSRLQEHGLIDTNQIINTTSFVNQTVSTNKIVFSCSDLNVKDVKVQSGAKLILDAAGDVIINGEFEVELGSELEIK